MFVEKRRYRDKIKYYLVHSYRDENNEVAKIRKFLGNDLSGAELAARSRNAERLIDRRLDAMKLSVFDFYLTDKEIASLNKFSDKLKIHHLNMKEWVLFTEEFAFDTNAIEGSTVLRDEVPKILHKKSASNSEQIETMGVARAVNFIRKTRWEFSLKLLLHLHKLCFYGSKDFAGQFRSVEVVIRDSFGKIVHQGTQVEELQDELSEFVNWYQTNKKRFKPLVLAAIVHNRFEDIHPFQDGNGRVGRLLLNYVLLKNGYPPINISLEDRSEYYRVLQRYSQHDELKPTLRFLQKQYGKTLKRVTTKGK